MNAPPPARPDLAPLDLSPLSGLTPVSRFAPSPTGYLHLGHVVNAIYVWGVTRAAGGRVLLRIEDHDRSRCRPEFETAILEDLDWLGFVPDLGRDPLDRQSDRPARYEAALRDLARRHHVYACACSRKAIGGEWYPGTCRSGRRPVSIGDAGPPEPATGCGIRVQMDPGVETMTDLLAGTLVQEPAAQCGDLLVRDRDGQWTYQFAVTVDDLTQQVTLVIRGADLIESSGRQVRLARMLGRSDAPLFLHHPLIMGDGGEKLSKAMGDTGIRELRKAGQTAADVIGRAAAAVGLVGEGVGIPAVEIPRLFATR